MSTTPQDLSFPTPAQITTKELQFSNTPVQDSGCELSGWSVFIDFDGTISSRDVGIYLLEKFARGHYEIIDRQYEEGVIGSRQYVTELWPLLSHVDPEDLVATAKEVELDSGFDPLLRVLTACGADVAVVSDGLGFYLPALLGGRQLSVRANQVGDDFRPTFPFGDASCPCGLCGTCKAVPVREARARGKRTAVVGDGTSDRYAAAEADLVFAKGRLISWCEEASIPYTPFEGLNDVQLAFERIAVRRGAG